MHQGARASSSTRLTAAAIAASAGALVIFVTPAAGCPICDAEEGRQVRAAIISEEGVRAAGAIAAPFVLTTLGALWLGRPPRRYEAMRRLGAGALT